MAYWRLVWKFGLRRLLRYDRERRRRERLTGVHFDPLVHGEPLLRAIGATETEIEHARKAGLA